MAEGKTHCSSLSVIPIGLSLMPVVDDVILSQSAPLSSLHVRREACQLMEKDEYRVGLLYPLDSRSLSIHVLGIKDQQKGGSGSKIHICSLYIYIYIYISGNSNQNLKLSYRYNT